jgi:membrane protease subunit HflC
MIKISKLQGLGWLIGLIALGLYSSIYFVPETQNAAQIKSSHFLSHSSDNLAIKQAGIYFKSPFDKVIRWDTRIQCYSFRTVPLSILESGAIQIDFNILYRIQKIDRYISSTHSFKLELPTLLKNWINQYLQTHWQATTLHDTLQFSFEKLKNECTQYMDTLGVEVLELNVIQRQATPSLRHEVLQKMSAHQKDLVQSLLEKGKLHANTIRTQAQTDRAIMLTNAQSKCENIKNQGNALATQLYIEAYRKNPKFAFFYQRLMSYERSFNTRTPSMIVMQSDAPLLL